MNTQSDQAQSPQNGNGKSHVEQLPDLRPHHHDAATPHANKPMGWKLTITVVILAAALAVGFFLVHQHRSDDESKLNEQTEQADSAAPTVDVVTAKPSPRALPLSLPGETHGWYQSTIYARVDGYVATWTADIGDHVKKGQVLATIATPDLDAQYQASLQQLAVAKSGIAVAQANANFAKTTYARWHNAPAGVVAPQETEEKQAGYQSSIAELQAAQAKVSAAAAEVDRLKALEGYKQVLAPYDGIITLRRIDIGNLVTAGSTSNTSPLYDIAQINVIRVFADVAQDVSRQITVGMPVRVTPINEHDRFFTGKVARTSSAIDEATRTLKVEVDIPNPQAALLPGLYVNVAFQIQRSGLVEVPASAMLFRTAGPQVAVVNGDNKINFHNVLISVDDGNTVDIGSGLKVGDRVALNLSSQISDGEQVTIANADKSPPPQATASAANSQ